MAVSGGTRRLTAWWPILCFLLIGGCWVLSTPPAAGVDEGSHYTRMIGMTQGGLIGGDVPADTQFPGLSGARLARVVKEMGMFQIPGNLPVPVACNAADPARPYDCPTAAPSGHPRLDVSYHARYLPLAYVVPAVISTGGDTTWRALVLGRLGFLLQDAALLALIVVGLRRCRRVFSSTSLGMLALCVTPLLAFQSGTLAPNGTEVFSVIAFLVALIAATRLRSRGWLWLAALVGGAACWTRDLGATEVLLFGVAALAVDPAGARWLWSRRRTRDVLAAVLLALAALGASLWQLVLKAGLPARPEGPSRLWADLGRTLGLLRDSIGLLGWANVPIDPVVQSAWSVAWVIGLALLVWRAPVRARWVAAALGAAYVIADLVIISGFRNAGFAAQSRFTMAFPIAIVVVLVVHQPAAAGPVSAADRPARWPQLPLAAACVVVAAGQFSGLLISAHRNANGLAGEPMDFTHVAWAPPGGWHPMLVAFAVACAAVLALPFVAAGSWRRGSGPEPGGDQPLL